MSLAVLERLLERDPAALVRHDEPQDEVDGQSHPEEEAQEDERGPDDQRVDAESAGEPGRNPREPPAFRGPGDAWAAQGVVEAVEAMSLRVGVSLLVHDPRFSLGSAASHAGRP